MVAPPFVKRGELSRIGRDRGIGNRRRPLMKKCRHQGWGLFGRDKWSIGIHSTWYTKSIPVLATSSGARIRNSDEKASELRTGRRGNI